MLSLIQLRLALIGSEYLEIAVINAVLVYAVVKKHVSADTVFSLFLEQVE